MNIEVTSKEEILAALKEDKKVKNIFTQTFTKMQFIDFIFINIVSLLISQADSCEILLEIIERLVY